MNIDDPRLDALLAEVGGRVALLNRDLVGLVQTLDTLAGLQGAPAEAAEYRGHIRSAAVAVGYMPKRLRAAIARARKGVAS